MAEPSSSQLTLLLEYIGSDEGEDTTEEVSHHDNHEWWTPYQTTIQEQFFYDLWRGHGGHHVYDNSYHMCAANARAGLSHDSHYEEDWIALEYEGDAYTLAWQGGEGQMPVPHTSQNHSQRKP